LGNLKSSLDYTNTPNRHIDLLARVGIQAIHQSLAISFSNFSRSVIVGRSKKTAGDGGTSRSIADEQSVGRGAADRVFSEVNVDWRRPGQRERSSLLNSSIFDASTST